LRDAVTAIEFIVKNNLFDQRIYNVLTENLTVNDIVDYIRKFIPNVEMKYVDTEIMNQLSYEVSCQRIKERGFEFKGDIRQDIAETIALLRQAGGRGDQ
jgi:nucleoside-diphosphate-sugar epimerase